MKKLLLLVGLVVLFFAHSSFAKKVGEARGSFSKAVWEFYEDYEYSHYFAFIDHHNKLDKKFRLDI